MTITDLTRESEFVYATGTPCHYCTNQANTIDHVVPKFALRKLFNIGSKSYHEWRKKAWNVVGACLDCNGKKAAKWPTCQCSFCRNAVRTFLERAHELALEENAKWNNGFVNSDPRGF